MAFRPRSLESLELSGVDPEFWAGRRVLLTGHTGFKGAWATLWLARMGATVTGLALPPEADECLFSLADVARDVRSHIVDIRDLEGVAFVVAEADPEIVIHMAAQPLVRRSIAHPVETFAVNVLGTVHLLEALRNRPGLLAAVVVTTDKVYENPEDGAFFVESAPLGGHEPYGASKAAAEIATAALAKTYFDASGVAVATARGGNVIGGGDFSEDRLIPDIIRAVDSGGRLILRNPAAIRPWQYVLDCLAGYFCFAQALAMKTTQERSLNFGPAAGEVSVAAIARSILKALGAEPEWDLDPLQSPHESNALNLDASRARRILGWRDYFPGDRGLEATVAWYLAWRKGEDMRAASVKSIDAFMSAQTATPKRTSIANSNS
jgi:CDP-glucose 4,6-dehydratase